jgi:hypothetical protein
MQSRMMNILVPILMQDHSKVVKNNIKSHLLHRKRLGGRHMRILTRNIGNRMTSMRIKKRNLYTNRFQSSF